MTQLESTTGDGHNDIPDALAQFGRAATLGGWAVLVVAVILARSFTVKVGSGYCGTGSAIMLSGGFAVHTLSQALAVALLVPANRRSASDSTRAPRRWLALAGLSLASCVGLISLVAWIG